MWELQANGIAQDAAGVITAGSLGGSAGTGGARLDVASNSVGRLGPFTADKGFSFNDDAALLGIVGTIEARNVRLTNTGGLLLGANIEAAHKVSLDADGILQLGGTIAAHTLTGTAGSGFAVLDSAGNDIADLDGFTAGLGFALQDKVPALKVGGAIDGGLAVVLVNSGSLELDASVTGTGLVTLKGDGIKQNASGIITTGLLTGSAGGGAADLAKATNLVTDLGPFTAATGFKLNDTVSMLTVTGVVNGGTGVTIANTGSLVIARPIDATGTVKLDADGIAQRPAGIITAGTLTGDSGAGAAEFSAATNLVTDLGPFTTATGFALNDGVPLLTVIGAIHGGPSVTLMNTGSLAIDAAIDPTSTVTLDADGISQTAAGIITAGTLTGDAGTGAADLGIALNLVTDLGPFTATTGFTLNDGVPLLTVVGAVDGGSGVSLTNTGSLMIDAAISATGTVALYAHGIAQDSSGIVTAGLLTGDAGSRDADFGAATNIVSDLGPFSAGRDFTLNDDTAKLRVIGAVDARAISLTNTGALAIEAALDADRTVTLTADGIWQNAAGVVTARLLTGDAGNRGADLGNADNVVRDLGPFGAGRDFTLNDDTKRLTVVGAVDARSIALTNTGKLAIDAALDGRRTVALDADGIRQDAAGIITARLLTGNAGAASADLNVADNDVRDLGPFSAAKTFTFTDDVRKLRVVGAVDAHSIDIDNTGRLAIEAAVDADRTVTLNADGIRQDAAGVITAHLLTGSSNARATDLGAAANLVARLGPFTAGDGFTLNDATGKLTVVGAVDGGPFVTLTNTGRLLLHAPLDGTDTVTLDANGIRQNAAGLITTGTLMGNAGTGAARLGDAVNVVTDLGPFAASTGFTLNDAVPLLTVIGAVNGGSGVALTNTGSLAIGAAVSGTGTVALYADGIGQDAAGVVTAGLLTGDAGAGAADFGAATNAVANLGPFTTTTGFTLNNATPALTVVGAIQGGPFATLINTGSLALDAAIFGADTVTLDANGITQNADGVITTALLTGTAGSGAADLGAAPNVVTDLGPFAASSGFTLNDTVGLLTVTGAVDGGTGVSLTNTGGLLIDAGLTGADTVALYAQGIAQSSDGVIAAGLLTGDAGAGAADFGTATNLVTDLGPFFTTTGFTLNNATSALTVVGEIVGGPFVTLVNSGSLTLDAAIDPTNTVTLDASGITQDSAGVITAGTLTGNAGAGDATLANATNLVVNLGPFAAGGTFQLLDGLGLTVIANVTAGTDAAITVTGAGNALLINPGVTVQSGGGATAALTATGGDLTNDGTVRGGVLASLTAGNDVFQNGLVTAAAVTETAGGTITHTGTTDATSGDATLTAITGTLDQTGTVMASDTASLMAGADILQSGMVMASNGDANLTAGGNLTQTNTVTAGHDAALTATDGTLDQTGTVTAGNTATFTAGADLQQSGVVTATSGDANLTAQGNLTQTNTVTAGHDATLIASTGTLDQAGSVTAGNDATLTATKGALDQTGIVSAGNTVTFAAGTDLLQTGVVTATFGDANLTAQGNLTQTDLVTAGHDVTLTATNGTLDQTGTGSIAAGHDATLTATNGALDQDGSVTAGNTATLVAGADLLQGGIIVATNGDADLTAGGDLHQTGSVTAHDDATLAASRDLMQDGTVIATDGDATLTASGNLTQARIVTAGNGATLTASRGTLDQFGTVTATDGDADLAATKGELQQTGTVVAGSAANLTAGGDLRQLGIVHAYGGNANLTAGGSLTQAAIVTASVDDVLTADTGSLTQTGSISAGTSAILQALAGNLSDSGSITAPNIQLSAPKGMVSFSGSFSGVDTDPALNPQFRLAQGAFPSNLSIGAWLSGSTIAVAPSAVITGAGGGPSQLVVMLTTPNGAVNFGNFNNQKTELYLDLGTGFASGQIEVATLQVEYAPPGTFALINLLGTVNGQSGSTAASASFIQPLRNNKYQVNGCPIESTSCIRITTLTLPVINPLKDLEVETPLPSDEILIILPDVGDRDY